MSTRPTKDEYYLDIAAAVSKRSTCLRRRYGAVIVKDDRIVSTGYNGAPSGMAHCIDFNSCRRANAQMGHGYDECISVHAEQNAIIFASKEELKGAKLYLYGWDFEKCDRVDAPTPCPLCDRIIKNSGIASVIVRAGEGILERVVL